MGCIEFLVDRQVLSRHPTSSLLPRWRLPGLKESILQELRACWHIGEIRSNGSPSQAGHPIKVELTFLTPAHAQLPAYLQGYSDLPTVVRLTGSSSRPSGARAFPGKPNCNFGLSIGVIQGTCEVQYSDNPELSQWPCFLLPLMSFSPPKCVVIAEGVSAGSWHPS